MDNRLDIRITTRSLVRQALPTIVSTLCMSVYMLTDGIFVARLINTSALSAVNIVMPLIMISIALGTMLAAGGSAIIARKMGEGKLEEARSNFTMLTIAAIVLGIVIAGICLIFIKPIIRFLGANDAIFGYCYDYAFMSLQLFPFGILAMLFQIFFITAGKAKLGMAVTLLGGVVTVTLDYLCIAVFKMGITGAAISTGVGYAVPALIGLGYFAFNRKGTLYFVKPRFDKTALIKSCTNGASEMVTNLSMSIITVLLNNTLMRMAGENGVASITIILYMQGLLNSAYMGYATGVAPVISYNYGKGNSDHLRQIYGKSKRLIGLCAIFVFAAAMIFAGPLVAIFSPAGSAVYDMAVKGLRLFSICFLFMGFSIYASAMFTALSNGRVSAIISVMRALVFVVICVLVLPRFLGLSGVWLAIPIAEALGLLVTIYFERKYKSTYQYA